MNSYKVKMTQLFVIPAKRGSIPRSGRGQAFQILTSSWIPAFARMITFYLTITFDFCKISRFVSKDTVFGFLVDGIRDYQQEKTTGRI